MWATNTPVRCNQSNPKVRKLPQGTGFNVPTKPTSATPSLGHTNPHPRAPPPPSPSLPSMKTLTPQGLYRISDYAEESRFFHGRARRGLADPSLPTTATPHPTPPPPPGSTLPLSLPGLRLPLSARPGLLSALGEEPPPVPRDIYRGRRRRRPRRRRSAPNSLAAAGAGGGVGGGGGGGEKEAAIDLPACREVVARELERLEGDLERRAARLARRRRR